MPCRENERRPRRIHFTSLARTQAQTEVESYWKAAVRETHVVSQKRPPPTCVTSDEVSEADTSLHPLIRPHSVRIRIRQFALSNRRPFIQKGGQGSMHKPHKIERFLLLIEILARFRQMWLIVRYRLHPNLPQISVEQTLRQATCCGQIVVVLADLVVTHP